MPPQKKQSFPLRISLVNLNELPVSCKFAVCNKEICTGKIRFFSSVISVKNMADKIFLTSIFPHHNLRVGKWIYHFMAFYVMPTKDFSRLDAGTELSPLRQKVCRSKHTTRS